MRLPARKDLCHCPTQTPQAPTTRARQSLPQMPHLTADKEPMATISVNNDLQLFRSMSVAAGVDPDWAATLALPAQTFERFPDVGLRGVAWVVVLRNVSGALVAPGASTASFQLAEILTDAAGNRIASRGALFVGVANYTEVQAVQIGVGEFGLGVLWAGLPGTVTDVEVYMKAL